MEILSESGALGLLAMVSGLIGLAISAVQLAIAKKVDLIPLVVGSTLATLLIGLLGFASGLYGGAGASALADPAEKAVLLARGLSAALSSTMVALLFAGLQTLLGAAAISVRQLVAAKPVSGGAP